VRTGGDEAFVAGEPDLAQRIGIGICNAVVPWVQIREAPYARDEARLDAEGEELSARRFFKWSHGGCSFFDEGLLLQSAICELPRTGAATIESCRAWFAGRAMHDTASVQRASLNRNRAGKVKSKML